MIMNCLILLSFFLNDSTVISSILDLLGGWKYKIYNMTYEGLSKSS